MTEFSFITDFVYEKITCPPNTPLPATCVYQTFKSGTKLGDYSIYTFITGYDDANNMWNARRTAAIPDMSVRARSLSSVRGSEDTSRKLASSPTTITVGSTTFDLNTLADCAIVYSQGAYKSGSKTYSTNFFNNYASFSLGTTSYGCNPSGGTTCTGDNSLNPFSVANSATKSNSYGKCTINGVTFDVIGIL